ncbi:hypothetical protein C922_05394 [Plasmodium inui San Antonio 1]|uniref:Uncharacterized protein n=1 Tax=Plasmodium inui San Antonio 1 TaxID=1237626 RepID=W6ZY43_9APIC|nr:hypothetical protein C922_05394 [Plasmodium inui San Antonio 1]EUD64228.1 hypothetical protein C922_05394 [Plasmodium inui San Antonio 1]
MAQALLGAGVLQEEWQGIVQCVMSHALSLNRIKVKGKKKEVEVWNRSLWSGIFKTGVGDSWGSSPSGQGMLGALACLMVALMGWPRTESGPSQKIISDCQEIWDIVGLDLTAKTQRARPEQGATMEDLVQRLGNPDPIDSSQYNKLGLILSIYSGMRKCCNYRKHYDLTSLITKGEEELTKLGQCIMTKETLNCEGGTGKDEGGYLNLWTRSMKSLSKATPKPPPTQVKLTETETRKELAATAPRNQYSTSHEATLLNWAADTLANHPGQESSRRGIQVLQQSQAKAKEVADRTNQDGTPRDQVGPPAELTTGSSVADPPQIHPARQSHPPPAPEQLTKGTIYAGSPPKALGTPAPSADNPVRTKSPVPTPLREGVSGLDPPSKELSAPRDERPHSESVKLGSIIGGVLGGILALASIYGVSRVYLLMPRTSSRAHASVTGERSNIGYGSSTDH